MAATLDRTAPAERDAWADDLAPGTTFAGYRIEAVAGRGGMGVVYKAIQLGLDRPVAIKVIAAGLLGDPRVRERFLREAHAAAAIEHPNVIPIHGAGEHLGRPFIVMRFVDGDDLRQRIRLDGPLAPGQAAELVAALAAALDAAHEAGVVHRDVKPANILLDGHGHAYLTDFGLARHTLSDAGLTAPGAWVGTLDFVAPEQIRGERIDGRVDVYALGCVLHFALTGQVPYPRETDEARLWAHLHAVAPAPSRAAAGVPAAFDDVVARALAKEPEGRPPSAGALGAAALTAAGGAPAGRTAQAGRTPGSATWADAPRRRPLRRVSRAVAVVAASAAAGAALAVVLAGRGQDRPATAASTATTGRPAAAARAATRPARPAVVAPHVAGTVRVARRPVNVEVAGGSAWVASPGNPTLGRISTSTNHHRPGPRLGYGITDIASRRGMLWVTVAAQREVVQVHAKTGHVAGHPILMNGEPRAIDAGEGAVWVAERSPTGADNLVEIDPHSAAIVGRLAVPEGINDIRAANGAVWVLGRRAPTLIKVSPVTRVPIVRLHVGRDARRLAVAAGYVWVTDYGENAVTRIDPKGPRMVEIGVPSRPYGLHARADGIWVACYGDQSVVRIDPRHGRVIGRPVPVGLNPVAVDVSHGSAWVTSVGDGNLTRIDL